MLILGIETSCDETAASVVRNGKDILSNIVSSSLNEHKRFGGVVPEIATRHHVENIDKVISRSLYKAGMSIKALDAIAVTHGPGLIGALLTGISCARAMAYSLNIPLIEVDHLKAHIYSALMGKTGVRFPFIGLVISGGHTRLYIVKDYDDCVTVGDTLDDAIGEAYDKVAKILGLGYPGGPVIDRLARNGNPQAIKFTCRGMKGSLNFSFSGVKTAVLYYVKKHAQPFGFAQGRSTTPNHKGSGQAHHPSASLRAGAQRNIAASFQEAALKVIVHNSMKAMEKYKIKTLVIGGGVSANSKFREMLAREAKFKNIDLHFPPLSLCSDNAAMVAGLGYRLYNSRHKTCSLKFKNQISKCKMAIQK